VVNDAATEASVPVWAIVASAGAAVLVAGIIGTLLVRRGRQRQ
jgi:hypothetical protein